MGVVLVSWNVHGWVGRDGARDPARTFAAIDAFDADVVALQEVHGEDWEPLAEAAGYHASMGRTDSLPYGNAVLLRAPPERLHRHDLSVPGRERRGALEAVVKLPAGALRVFATHLGLRAAERRRQANQLAREIEARDPRDTLVLLGDFNDWTPWGGQLAALARTVGPLSRIPTFPSRRAVLPLDRVAWRPAGLSAHVEAVRTPDVRLASDHLPLRLELELTAGGAAAPDRV